MNKLPCELGCTQTPKIMGFAGWCFTNVARVEQDEIIPPSVMYSMDDGKTLRPIVDFTVVGRTPADFTTNTSFWKIQEIIRRERNHSNEPMAETIETTKPTK